MWKDFEQMGELYKKMFEILFSCEDMAEYEAIEAEFMEHLKEFVFKCRDISKIGNV